MASSQAASTPPELPSLSTLRETWTTLYTSTLPLLAQSHSPLQTHWPVHLDHCFARIILDNTIGRGVLQWDNVIARPAVRNMDVAQLTEAIGLGERIAKGEVDLVELDRVSLRVRGKDKGGGKYQNVKEGANGKKRPRVDDVEEENGKERGVEGEDRIKSMNRISISSPPSKKNPKSNQPTLSSFFTKSPSSTTVSPIPVLRNPNLEVLLHRIASHVSLTPFRRRLYSTLLSVPAGHYTTYASMATYLESSPRAIGNGMRNNPFAPDVPCHRVLAADGSIGGFGGDWGEEGKHASKKKELLRVEGVRFDGRGRVRGGVFGGLRDMREVVILDGGDEVRVGV